jgi:hypothetical protein
MPWRGPEVDGEFPTLGYLAADWIEANLVIPDGPKLGQPFTLYDEQLMHVLRKYRLDPSAVETDGNDAFMFGGSMIVRGQKWGKDPLLAALALFHAFGPCDFAGWDAAGDPVGRPHPSPWVGIAALNDKQTDNTWLPLVAMAKASLEIVDTEGVEVFDTFIRLPCGNPIEPLTTTAWGRLGGRFTKVTITENGVLTGSGDRGGLAFARTLKRSVSGMNGMWTAATNTWDPTELSDAQLVFEAGDPHTLVDARISRKHIDLDNDEELEAELAYLYGDSLRTAGGHVSAQRLMRDCRNTAYGEAEVRRFFLSEILAGEAPLCTPERWAILQRENEPLAVGEKITLGFDGSRSRDATALTACRVRDGRIFHLRTVLPACPCGPKPRHRRGECKAKKIDRVAVDQAVRDAFGAYEVWYLYADPYKWQDYLDQWASSFPKRPDGKAGVIVELPTNNEVRMDHLVERFTTARDNGEITHDGHPDLTEHVRHAAIAKGRRKNRLRVDDAGKVIEHYLKVVKKRDGLLIDNAISMLLAYEARGQAIEDGALTDTTVELAGSLMA